MIGTLEEVMKDMKSGIFDFTKDGKCSVADNVVATTCQYPVKKLKKLNVT